MTRLLASNVCDYLISLPSFPNTASLILILELLWKSSNVIDETAPLTLEAIDLQASPTKSLTANNFYASFGSSLLTLKCQL
jgi:hypothetical protein